MKAWLLRSIAGFVLPACLALLLVPPGLQASPGYYQGSYFAGHVQRMGGKLVSNPATPTGLRWEDYDIVRVAPVTRIPAIRGHGLEIYAELYGLPQEATVTFKLTRSVRGAAAAHVDQVYTRRQKLEYLPKDRVHRFSYVYFLDEEAELLPGVWVVELAADGEQLLRQVFEIYRVDA